MYARFIIYKLFTFSRSAKNQEDVNRKGRHLVVAMKYSLYLDFPEDLA